MISTRIHGMMDYLVALLLFLFPVFFELPDGAATFLPVFMGAGTVLYSLSTDYELGMINIFSMRTHLMIDLAAGIFFLASPWLFGFADEVIWPFVIVGAFEILASLMTSKKPSVEEAHDS